MSDTGNPLDLAIGGAGFFRVRSGDAILYSRQGQFRRAEDGRVVTLQGHVLQAAGGGDLVIDRADVVIARIGQVVDGGWPVGRIALYAPAEGQAVDPLEIGSRRRCTSIRPSPRRTARSRCSTCSTETPSRRASAARPRCGSTAIATRLRSPVRSWRPDAATRGRRGGSSNLRSTVRSTAAPEPLPNHWFGWACAAHSADPEQPRLPLIATSPVHSQAVAHASRKVWRKAKARPIR